jgi:hypothetical protein
MLTNLVAILLSFGAAVWLEQAAELNDGIVVLAVVLTVTLSRQQLRPYGLGVLPVVAVAASEVGWLFVHHPTVGDVVFTVCISAAIWIRRYGVLATKIGTLATLPFIAVLISPVPPGQGAARLLWPAIVAVIAFLSMAAVRLTDIRSAAVRRAPGHARAGAHTRRPGPPRTTAAPRSQAAGAPRAASTPQAPHSLQAQPSQPPRAPQTSWAAKVPPSTRMACQMALSLGAAFVVGRLVFPGHWTWTVLTAFLVCSGARNRGDVLHKGALRVTGASVGTLVATPLAGAFGPHEDMSLALILAVLALATWLRRFSYAYWAGTVTAVLSLLNGYYGQSGHDLLLERLAEIVVGAVLGIAASWFVLPIRSADAVRRRTANSLLALRNVLTAAGTGTTDLRPSAARFDLSLEQLDQILPSLEAHRRLVRFHLLRRRPGMPHPADTADAIRACAGPVRTLTALAAGDGPGDEAEFARITEDLVHELEALDTAFAGVAKQSGLPMASGTGRESRQAGLPGPAQRHAPPPTTARVLPNPAPAPVRAQAAQAVGTVAPAATGTDSTAPISVSGSVYCGAHPHGCPTRITVINARGQRVAQTHTEAGPYRLSLRPGSHTLVVSATGHPPRAQSVMVWPSQADLRLDIHL